MQVGLGFLSDVENMGMYDGEMQDGQPHGNGTIGKDNMFRSSKIIHCIGALIVNNNGTDQVAIRINNYFSVYLSNDKFGRANYSGEWRYICSNTVNFYEIRENRQQKFSRKSPDSFCFRKKKSIFTKCSIFFQTASSHICYCSHTNFREKFRKNT